ncbi:MAG: hypothetical protein K9M10_02610 [Candidatus Pacebacteria bacterium]|nr:hypothetical protein [Candidatus Paceibacterota bacterium]MCF7857348.1 hypothetical protein [Candidatus Paceibacterota bacterium]
MIKIDRKEFIMSKKIKDLEPKVEPTEEEVAAYEKLLRLQVDSWGYLVVQQEKPDVSNKKQPWIRRKPPGIQVTGKVTKRRMVQKVFQFLLLLKKRKR